MVREIQSVRLPLLGHVERKEDDCNVKTVTKSKPIGNGPRGKPKM